MADMDDQDSLTDSGDRNVFEAPYTLMVDFHGTESTYSLYEDLECKFSFKDSFKFDDLSACTVKILKVGWERSQDAVVSIRISDTDVFGTGMEKAFLKGVVYSIHVPSSGLLHHTDREYYQFCFLWQNSVLGASQPFQIQENESSEADASDIEIIKEGDLEWWYETSGKLKSVTDEDEPVLVPSERKIIEDTIDRLMEENSILKQNKKEALDEMDTLREQLIEFEKQKLVLEKVLLEKSSAIAKHVEHLAETEVLVKRLEEKNLSLEKQNLQSKNIILVQEKQVNELKTENENLLERIKEEGGEEKSKIIRVYEIKLQNMKDLFEGLEQELNHEKNEKDQMIEKFHEQRRDYKLHAEELYNKMILAEEQLHDANKENEDLFSKTQEERESYLASVEGKDKEINELLKELEGMRNSLTVARRGFNMNLKGLEARLAQVNSDVIAKNEIIQSLEAQIELLQQGSEAAEVLIAKVEEGKRKEKMLTDNIENLEKTLGKYQTKTNELQTECVKSKGTRHALKVAYAHMEQKNAALRDERDDAIRMVQGLKKQLGGTPSSVIIEEQNKEIEDLKLRLCMGSNAYKEKFLECRKFEQEVKRLKGTPTRSLRPQVALQRSCSAQAPDVTDVHGPSIEVLKRENSVLSQENAELRAKIEVGEKELCIVKSQLQKSQSTLGLTRTQLKEKENSISLQDSLLGEERQRNLQSNEEIRRLEDVIQAKDAEIKQLKEQVDQGVELQPMCAGSMMGLVASKEKHEKKIENLRLECERYKKILSGVNQVIHNKKLGKDASLERENISEAGHKSDSLPEEASLPDADDGVMQNVRLPSPVLREPHMESIRDAKRGGKADIFTSHRIKYPVIYQQRVPGTSALTGRDLSARPKDNFAPENFGSSGEEKTTQKEKEASSSGPVMNCPVCQQFFPLGTQDHFIAVHVNSHFEC